MTQVEQGENPPQPRFRVRRIENPEAVLRDSWSFHDVLWLGLAGLPEGVNRLTGDTLRWQEVVARLKDQTREIAPELFAKVLFDRRPGGPVYSDEVQRFLSLLTPNHWRPDDNTFDISERAKEYAIKRRRDKLVEHEGVIQQMGQQLESLVVAA